MIVKNARRQLYQADYFPKDGDRIWCVFDCDANKNSELREAEKYAHQKGYKIAYSNPCFEYWYLLHYTKYNAYIKDGKESEKLLKDKLERYTKTTDVFAELLPYQAVAIKRANERLEALAKDNTVILSCESNPVTTVRTLVEYLNSQNNQ